MKLKQRMAQISEHDGQILRIYALEAVYTTHQPLALAIDLRLQTQPLNGHSSMYTIVRNYRHPIKDICL